MKTASVKGDYPFFTAVFKKFREDYNDIPCLTIAYDGLEQANAATRLEAFIYQANQYHHAQAAVSDEKSDI